MLTMELITSYCILDRKSMKSTNLPQFPHSLALADITILVRAEYLPKSLMELHATHYLPTEYISTYDDLL